MKFDSILNNFASKNVLLLQGPIGPFFNLFSKKMKACKAKVFKLNFNGGDKFFYPLIPIHTRENLYTLEVF